MKQQAIEIKNDLLQKHISQWAEKLYRQSGMALLAFVEVTTITGLLADYYEVIITNMRSKEQPVFWPFRQVVLMVCSKGKYSNNERIADLSQSDIQLLIDFLHSIKTETNVKFVENIFLEIFYHRIGKSKKKRKGCQSGEEIISDGE